MDKSDLQKGQVLSWIRTVPNCDLFDVVDIKVHSIQDSYFTGLDIDPRSQRTYMFNYNQLDNDVLFSRTLAIAKCKALEDQYYEKHKKHSSESSNDIYE